MKRTILLAILYLDAAAAFGQTKPNIVLIFPDNLGMGEVASYGGARGVPTPNIDRIGTEGIRFANFNVEYSCIPSRIAILSGRYATRTGNGMTLWEKTVAEGLQSVGYATALVGKYDVGGTDWQGKREPMQQGFDEWYGIPGTSHVSQFTSFEGFDTTAQPVPYVWEGSGGKPSRKVKPFDVNARRTIDREAAERGIAFIERNAKSKKPFFLYYPMTQLHFPTLPHPDKAGKTGAGDVGDAMADVDHNVGLILEALKRLGIEKNTLVIWCSDNGAEMRRPWRGTSGPWRGFYNSAMEGGIRTPCVIRWPGRIKAGQVTNEMMHEVDLFATLAAAAGAPDIVPKDRAFDGVDQLPFLEGKQSHSNRESAIFMNANGQVMAVKWRDWKFWYQFRTEMPDPEPDNLLRLFDLRVDPEEEIDVKDYYPGVISIMDRIVKEYEASLVAHPRVPGDAADPYTPPVAGSVPVVPTYTRTDRRDPGNRTAAIARPDFSGSWSTAVLDVRSPLGRVDQPPAPTLGSGWGSKITIKHTTSSLEIERVVFTPRELQPLIRYRYALDGSTTENALPTGRSGNTPASSTAWDGNRLVITSTYFLQDSWSGKLLKYNVIQTLWLQATTVPPFEPTLVVETVRDGVLGGIPSMTRTAYTKGYR